MTTLLGPRALPDGTGQRGHSPVAAPVSRALRFSAPVWEREFKFPSWSLRIQIFVLFAVLMPVIAASAQTSGQDRVPKQLVAVQEWRHSFFDRWCPPGFHVSEDGEKCITCTYGVDYTIHWNKLLSCLPCTTCKSEMEESVPCSRTKNTQCQCEPGTFLEKESPEFCQKCLTRCPDGMVEAEPCTPWSNLKCVKQESGSSQLVIGTVSGVVTFLLLLVLVICACCPWRRICEGSGVDPKCMNRVFFRRLCPPRGPGALDNACNEIVSQRVSLSSQASEQQLKHQAYSEMEEVVIESPAEVEHLLGHAEAEGSQMTRELLVPANNTDPIESLRLFFDYFTDIIPYNSWNPLMRLMGLSDNDICVARAQASNPREAFYEMLVTWLKNKGRAASVNDLLEALETLGDRHAKELIQDHLVCSGKFVYEGSINFVI